MIIYENFIDAQQADDGIMYEETKDFGYDACLSRFYKKVWYKINDFKTNMQGGKDDAAIA